MNEQQPSILGTDSRDFYLPDAAQIEELRRIIRAESGHKFTYDETRDVAYQLIRFYECLAGEKPIVPEGFYERQ